MRGNPHVRFDEGMGASVLTWSTGRVMGGGEPPPTWGTVPGHGEVCRVHRPHCRWKFVIRTVARLPEAPREREIFGRVKPVLVRAHASARPAP